jgi:hypothetical protein
LANNESKFRIGRNSLPRIVGPWEAKTMIAIFTRHPRSVGETYFEHMAVAGSFGTRLLRGALACYVHALLPFLFEKTASATVAALHDRMLVSRRRRSPATTAAGTLRAA